MKKTVTVFFVLSCAVSLFLTGSPTTLAAEKVVKLRFATASFPGLTSHSWTIKFAEVMKEKTNGKYLIEPIQERKLGGDKDNIEMGRAGAIEMGISSAALFDAFLPDLNALQMPFLINGYDTLREIHLADFTRKLLTALEKINLHALGLIEEGRFHIGNNVRSIYKPEDLKGIKLRVAETKMHQELFQALGAIPIPVSYGEIYTSLKTGVINGTETNASSASSEKLMEVLTHFSLTGHFFWPGVIYMNKDVWDKIPPADQRIFEEVIVELVPWEFRYCKNRDETAMQTMKKRGIKINQVDAKSFFEKSKPIYQKYMQYTAIADFVKAVQAMQK